MLIHTNQIIFGRAKQAFALHKLSAKEKGFQQDCY